MVNLSINAPSKSLSKILILAIDPDDRKQFAHTEKFKNLDITKVKIGIEGVEKVNALYASGMEKHNTHDQILKVFRENGVTLREFLTDKYALSFDLRPSIDNTLHGNGANLQNTSEGVTLEIHRVAGTGNGKLNLHVLCEYCTHETLIFDVESSFCESCGSAQNPSVALDRYKN